MAAAPALERLTFVRVYVPATPALHPTVLPAVIAAGYPAVVVPMRARTSYFDLVAELWRRGEDFALVEHDIEVGADTLRRFDRCSGLWCAHSYPVFAGDIAQAYGGPFGLGCVRFRAELLAAHPWVLDEVGEMWASHWPPKDWRGLDSSVTQWLKGPLGIQVCHHLPSVTHHHDYSQGGTR